jgi:hypothetical protein
MISSPVPFGDTAETADTLDQILGITWIASEIALDVFGMLFWSALGLCLAATLT